MQVACLAGTDLGTGKRFTEFMMHWGESRRREGLSEGLKYQRSNQCPKDVQIARLRSISSFPQHDIRSCQISVT